MCGAGGAFTLDYKGNMFVKVFVLYSHSQHIGLENLPCGPLLMPDVFQKVLYVIDITMFVPVLLLILVNAFSTTADES